MANYDEDLHENHFFKALVETNNALYSKAADNKWLVSSEAVLFKCCKYAAIRYVFPGAILCPD